MKSYCLASSSYGNCFIFDFELGDHALLMVECGLPYKEIVRKCNELNLDLSQVKNCLITHAHQDHCCSAKELNFRGMRIWASKDTLSIINLKGNELALNEPKKVENGVFVLPFEVEHDIDGAVGFIIKTKNETILFANDNKRWKANLINFKPDFVFIECNYDQKIVYARLGEYKKLAECELPPVEAKENYVDMKGLERVVNTHSSLAGTIKSLKKLNLTNCKAIFLLHLSDRHANEFRMKNEVAKETGIRTYVCLKNGSIK